MNARWFERVKRGKFLVGVSGGVDSMALLYLLKEHGFGKVVVCHLNHGLRGRESDGDERFVVREAKRLGYEVEARKVDVRKRSVEDGCSLETAGRSVRHEFFAECAGRHGCRRVLLAHHADDQAETVLWNVLRGSLGLRGMREQVMMKVGRKELVLMRPLLGVRKRELEEWMKEKGFGWREDSTNGVNDVVRNRLRNEVMPLLGEVVGRDVVPHLVRAAEVDEGWRELLDWAAAMVDVMDPQGRIHAGVMRGLPDVLKKAVFAGYLKDRGIGGVDSALLERLVGLLDVDGAASMNLPGGVRLRRKAGRIFLG